MRAWTHIHLEWRETAVSRSMIRKGIFIFWSKTAIKRPVGPAPEIRTDVTVGGCCCAGVSIAIDGVLALVVVVDMDIFSGSRLGVERGENICKRKPREDAQKIALAFSSFRNRCFVRTQRRVWKQKKCSAGLINTCPFIFNLCCEGGLTESHHQHTQYAHHKICVPVDTLLNQDCPLFSDVCNLL